MGVLTLLAQTEVSDKKDLYPHWNEILAGVSGSLSVVLVGFEIFVAILQAFIFSILSASYIGQALAEEH